MDNVLRRLGAMLYLLWKSPLLHVRAMRSCYSMNNLRQGYNIQNKILFLSSYPPTLSSRQIGCRFCERKLLHNVCFLTPSKYTNMKRNKNLRNPQKKSF